MILWVLSFWKDPQTCWMAGVNGRQECGWTQWMPHNYAFPHIDIQEQRPEPPALCVDSMQLLLCLQVLAAFWCLCDSQVFARSMVQQNKCTAMETRPPVLLCSLLCWAACPSSFPRSTGIYGHNSNKKELRKVISLWYSFMVKLLKFTCYILQKPHFSSLDLLSEDY